MLTIRPSGSAPDAARSLRLTAAARKPRSRQEIQSSRKWTPSTRASCVTTSPPTCAASFSIAWARPRRSSSARSPSSPRSESRIDLAPDLLRVDRSADDGHARGAGADTRPRVRDVDSTDRNDREVYGVADLGEADEADRRVRVGL